MGAAQMTGLDMEQQLQQPTQQAAVVEVEKAPQAPEKSDARTFWDHFAEQLLGSTCLSASGRQHESARDALRIHQELRLRIHQELRLRIHQDSKRRSSTACEP